MDPFDGRPAALLLTDLVDSAALAQRLGDEAMGRLWAAHDRVARDLRALVVGATITSVACDWPGTIQTHAVDAFADAVSGRVIEAVGRRGKRIVVELSGDEVVLAWTEVLSGAEGSTTPPASRVRTAVMSLK